LKPRLASRDIPPSAIRRSEVEFELQHEITRRLELLGAAQLAVTAEGVHELVAGDFRPRLPMLVLARDQWISPVSKT